jgi:hypothetical protein
MGTMSGTLFGEAEPGDNNAIGWEQAFYSPDTQIKVYPAISPGGYNIIRCKPDKGTTVYEPLHQVAIYCFPYFFIFVHSVHL